MSPTEQDLDEDRRMLVRLLQKDDDGPILGISNLTHFEREFLITTCAVSIIIAQICRLSGYNEGRAKAGLKALELDRHIEDMCRARN